MLHQKSSGLLLLLAAGMLGTFGVGLAAHAFLRGKSTHFVGPVWLPDVGGLAWLLPVAAVFALYGFWMQPSLYNLNDPPPKPVTPVTVERMKLNGPVQPVAGRTYLPNPNPDRISETSAVATGTSLPEWVQDKEFITGNVRLAVVTGEIGATVEEAGRQRSQGGHRSGPRGLCGHVSASGRLAAPRLGRGQRRHSADLRRGESTAKRSPREPPSASTAATTRSSSRRAVRNQIYPLWRDRSRRSANLGPGRPGRPVDIDLCHAVGLFSARRPDHRGSTADA